VLELNNKNIEQIMTPIKVSVAELVDRWGELTLSCRQDVVTLSSDTILDAKAFDNMCVITDDLSPMLTATASLQSGYSRFPVHKPGQPLAFIGLLLIKKVVTELSVAVLVETYVLPSS
jgi:metal transporter CNNM